jgi:hypothetical protein
LGNSTGAVSGAASGLSAASYIATSGAEPDLPDILVSLDPASRSPIKISLKKHSLHKNFTLP